MTDKMTLSDQEWRARLSPEQYAVLRQAGTERAFTGRYDANKQAGEYACAGCGQPLFESDAKFDSGSGWPSFTRPINAKAVATSVDRGLFMVRTEVHCANCGGHIGHVFPDGPPPTGKRYCMNGVAMQFVPA